MKYLLDSNTCIGWLRKNQPQIVQRIKATPPTDIALCSIVVGELLFGVERSDPSRRVQASENLEEFQKLFLSLPFDDEAAEIYARVRADLTTRGLLIGGNDMMIAAIALAHGLTLVTHNTGEFSRIPGLQLEDWQ